MIHSEQVRFQENDNSSIMNITPIPRKFEPSDEELIDYYLRGKIMNLEFGGVDIPEVTIYGDDLNPWDKFCDGNNYPMLRAMDGMGNDADYDKLIVFSKITNVGKKTGDFQKNRVAGDGTWHGNHKKVVIYNGVKIGYSRLLTFQLTNGKETLGHWTMNEYTIDPAAYPGLPSSDWVVCKIKRHHGKSSVDGKVITSEESCKPKTKKRRQISTAPAPATISASKEDQEEAVNHTAELMVNLDAGGNQMTVHHLDVGGGDQMTMTSGVAMMQGELSEGFLVPEDETIDMDQLFNLCELDVGGSDQMKMHHLDVGGSDDQMKIHHLDVGGRNQMAMWMTSGIAMMQDELPEDEVTIDMDDLFDIYEQL